MSATSPCNSKTRRSLATYSQQLRDYCQHTLARIAKSQMLETSTHGARDTAREIRQKRCEDSDLEREKKQTENEGERSHGERNSTDTIIIRTRRQRGEQSFRSSDGGWAIPIAIAIAIAIAMLTPVPTPAGPSIPPTGTDPSHGDWSLAVTRDASGEFPISLRRCRSAATCLPHGHPSQFLPRQQFCTYPAMLRSRSHGALTLLVTCLQ